MTSNTKRSATEEKIHRGAKEPILAVSIGLFVLWTLATSFSWYWNIKHLNEEAVALAVSEARSNWDKDQAFRGWATRHGGIYVKPDKRTSPNPYLAHIPARDVVTTGGVALTLMNPAYMMRQITEEYEQDYGIKGSITGKVLLNPINKADEWELKALDQFAMGKKEILETTDINGAPFIRFMKPMYMKKGCVKCHGHLGFKQGDLRGGVSVSIPLNKYFEASNASIKAVQITHLSVWAIGCLGIVGFAFFSHKRQLVRNKLQQAIVDHQNYLEERVEQRTEELLQKEMELRDSHARAHHANKLASLGEMASGMAHEINSPLQSILLITNRLKKSATKESGMSLDDDLERIDKSTSQIANIIESLRKMSRDSSDDPFVDIPIQEIFDDVLGITAERYRLQDITFSVNYVDNCEGTTVCCQRLQIGQVIMNLLNNAYDAIQTLNHKWIKLDATISGENIVISVTDSGKGINVDENKIFEPMYTTKEIGQGTGLGLSISSEIIRNHNGTLLLDKKSEHTRFVVQLPRKRKE